MKELGLDRWILKMCEKMNFINPTKIQQLAIPEILKGKNVIAHSETGSGKTACFSFPILQNLAKDPFSVYALVLTPNRELAFQIAEQVAVFGSSINTRCVTVVGGMDMIKQAMEIEKLPHFIIATPGRLLDLINRDEKTRELLGNLKYLVLDEVDRLLDDSIIDDLKEILAILPKERQCIFTTATLNKKVEDNLEFLLGGQKEVVKVEVNKKAKTVEGLTQQYLFIPDQVKDNYFIHLLNEYRDKSCIVFVSNCM